MVVTAKRRRWKEKNIKTVAERNPEEAEIAECKTTDCIVFTCNGFRHEMVSCRAHVADIMSPHIYILYFQDRALFTRTCTVCV